MRIELNRLAICSALVVALPVTQAHAACLDDASAAFAASPQFVQLCSLDHCETARLTRLCGNVQYSSEDYTTNSDQWLFRVRFHEDGDDDDERFVFMNGSELPMTATQSVTCLSTSSANSCELINRILDNTYKK